jgi:hypothetical protein
MKRLLWIPTIASAMVLSFGSAAQAQDMMPHAAEGEQVTMVAHVVDLSCKVVYNLQGEEMHRECAQVCADKGIPLGFIDADGELYLPVSQAMPGSGANEMLRGHAEHQVTVVGKVIKRGGLNTIVIESVSM